MNKGVQVVLSIVLKITYFIQYDKAGEDLRLFYPNYTQCIFGSIITQFTSMEIFISSTFHWLQIVSFWISIVFSILIVSSFICSIKYFSTLFFAYAWHLEIAFQFTILKVSTGYWLSSQIAAMKSGKSISKCNML